MKTSCGRGSGMSGEARAIRWFGSLRLKADEVSFDLIRL
jgi:hypothetical protein